MWKTILLLFLLIYFLMSVSGKILRFLRQFEEPQKKQKPEKEGTIRIFTPKNQKNKKDFSGGEYTDYEEIKH
ncbi:MAG: hypothetical protein SFU27_11350 [Thermonemataceae bacterium]|nr:hypothetical protein [Thermonemataceae bacterium]